MPNPKMGVGVYCTTRKYCCGRVMVMLVAPLIPQFVEMVIQLFERRRLVDVCSKKSDKSPDHDSATWLLTLAIFIVAEIWASAARPNSIANNMTRNPRFIRKSLSSA